MTVAARSIGGRAAARPASSRRAALFAAGSLFAALPAHAQVSGSIDVESDYRRRGVTLSAGRPIATAQIGYDDPSGAYLNISATGEAGRDDPFLLGAEGNIGYARRIGGGVSIDAGLVVARYRAPERLGRSHNYTEAYLGLTAAPLSARIYYSPDYYGSGTSTLYGEVEGSISPARNWRLNAHVGGLVYLDTTPVYFTGRAARYDWRLGIARQFGAFELHTALSGGGPGHDYYGGRTRDTTALTVGASWSF